MVNNIFVAILIFAVILLLFLQAWLLPGPQNNESSAEESNILYQLIPYHHARPMYIGICFFLIIGGIIYLLLHR